MKKGVVFGVVLLFSIMLSSATGVTNICLRSRETVYYSQCSPGMDDYVCGETSCQLCVNEISSGIYCPAAPQECNNACFYIYNSTDQNSTVALVSPDSDAKMAPGNVVFTFQTSLPTTLDRCDLYINDVRKKYTTTPKVTNSITVKSMDAGTYEWRIECKESASYGGDTITSPSRMLYLEIQNSSNESSDNNTEDINSTLEGWQKTINEWKEAVTNILANITTTINGLIAKINNHEARITTLENRKPVNNTTIINNTINNTLIINNTYILNNTLPNYFKYLSSSDRKKLVCGLAEEKHLTSLIDLGWNCTITYRQYRSGERAVCRCENV